MEISRHKLKNLNMIQMIIDDFESQVSNLLLSLEQRPQNLAIAYKEALEQAVYAFVLGKQKEEIIEYLSLSLQLGVAHFSSALELPEIFPIQFRGQTYSYSHERSTAFISPIDWSKIFHLAIVLRNGHAIKFLSGISTDALREANVKEDEVDYLYVDFLKGLFNKEVNIGELLIQVMDATDPERLPERRYDFILYIRVPELVLYRCFLSNKEAEFNQKLVEALELHKEFWTKTPEKSFDSDGLLSLPLLAVAALAFHNKIFRLTAQSDYLPMWLVKGEL
ncbi:MAG: immunity 49 family protein [Cyanobacteria bacterium RM1_2_2]|nr:immunity 49 family protein [Cyanobacteria bacterium RM1_2_2]